MSWLQAARRRDESASAAPPKQLSAVAATLPGPASGRSSTDLRPSWASAGRLTYNFLTAAPPAVGTVHLTLAGRLRYLSLLSACALNLAQCKTPPGKRAFVRALARERPPALGHAGQLGCAGAAYGPEATNAGANTRTRRHAVALGYTVGALTHGGGDWGEHAREAAAHYNTNGSNRMSMVRSGFWRDFWALFRPYWFSEEKVIARLLLVSIILLTLASVYMDVQFNAWYNLFYNTLQDKNKSEFYNQIGRFCVLAAIYIVIYVYATYLNQMLQIRWRRWLTRRYLNEWMSDRTYYRMHLSASQTDNPDQRISEDLKLFVDSTLSLSLGLLNAVVTLVPFVNILWSLSGTLEFPMGGNTYVVYGYMVWVALGYALVGTWLAHKIGKPLAGLNFNQQRFEADFRFNLVRFRENMEGVALYHGEEDEMRGLRDRFTPLYANWWAIMRRQKNLNFFTIGYNQVAVVFPFLVGAPRYFSGALPMGGLIQISHAFGKVQEALSWFINLYASLAAWRATVDRLTGFHNAVALSQEQTRNNVGIATVSSGGAATLALDHVELDLPNGHPLLANGNLTIAPGARVLVQGPSGSGKSTLFRAIAGIWPFGRGRIVKPRDFNALFLPQRPYFPLGTLREAVLYPMGSRSSSDEEVREALNAVGLAHLIARLDESANWAMQLSGGEQQRMAFARALLHQPSWLFLDEASSNLDDASQARLYELLTHRLKDCTIVSIAHREELASYHQQRVVLQPTPGGTHRLNTLQAQPA